MITSPLTTRTETSYYNGLSREGRKPERLILHHTTATVLEPAIAFMRGQNSRSSCSNYLLGAGQIVALIGEEYRPSSTGRANDLNSITVEMLNETAGPDWRIRDVDMENLARLLADLSTRYDWGKLVLGTNVRIHRDFAATACPGPYAISRLPWLIARANEILDQGSEPVEHVVVVGDTLSSILTQYNISLAKLEELNPGLTQPGQVLRVPGKPTPPPVPPTPGKTVAEVAREVIRGDWGNGQVRRDRLTAAGYNPDEVQAEVNRQLGLSPSPGKSIDTLAREVIRGDWGNDPQRSQRLRAAGHDPVAVQRRVNEILAGK